MQCPNCGKEAINVNGRYVCLDCGVEITPDGAPVVGAPLAPAVDNHGPLDPSPVTPDPQTASLDQVVNPVQPEPVVPVAPISETPAPVPAEPVKEYFMNALNQDAEPAGAEMPAVQPSGAIPDFPAAVTPTEPTVSSSTEMPTQVPVEPPVASTVEPEPNLSMDSSFMAGPTPEPELSATIEQPTVAEPVAEPAAATPESFFQPSSLNIEPATEPATPETPEPAPVVIPEPEFKPLPELQDTPPVAPAPDFPAAESTPEVTEPPVVTSVEPTETEIPINVVKPEEPTATPEPAFGQTDAVVDPLASVSPTPDELPGANTSTPANFPGAGTLPTAESVFGTPPETPAVQNVGSAQKPFNRKLVWILVAVVGGLLLLAGAFFAYSAFFAPKSSQQGATQNVGQIDFVALSGNVSGEMDKTTDVAASLNQTLDFSKATPKDSSQALFFSKPNVLKETWVVDKNQNISIDGTQNDVVAKRTYIKTDNATYVYSNDTKAYVKTDGQNLSPASVFFPIDQRGYLFYASRVDSFQSLGTENIDGVEAKKYKVVPKAVVIEDLLTASNSAFAKINYTDVNLDNLNVTAWVDDQNRIVKIDVSGTVQVSSDIYNGVVGINANGNYKYQEQSVSKPA